MRLDEHELADRIGDAIGWDGGEVGWDDVLARAALVDNGGPLRVERRHWRVPRRGRSLVIAAALLLIGGSIAFALAGRIVDAFDPPPYDPTAVQALAIMSREAAPPPAGVAPSRAKAQPGSVIPGSVRLLFRLETRSFGVVKLYGARAQRGICFVIARGGAASGQCSSDRVPRASPMIYGFDTSRGTPSADLVDGHAVSARARALRIRFRHSHDRIVPIRGRFFLFELGADHSALSADPPVAFDVLDAAGASLGSRLDPLRRAVARPLASSLRPLVHARLPLGGGRATLSLGRNDRGTPCLQLLVQSGYGTYPTWSCSSIVGRYGLELDNSSPSILHRVPVSWTLGQSPTRRDGATALNATFAYGWVASGVTRLQVVFQNGQSSRIALHRRYFLYAIPGAHWRAGARPSVLRAYGPSGRLLYHQYLYPHESCLYPSVGVTCEYGPTPGPGIGGAVSQRDSGGFAGPAVPAAGG